MNITTIQFSRLFYSLYLCGLKPNKQLEWQTGSMRDHFPLWHTMQELKTCKFILRYNGLQNRQRNSWCQIAVFTFSNTNHNAFNQFLHSTWSSIHINFYILQRFKFHPFQFFISNIPGHNGHLVYEKCMLLQHKPVSLDVILEHVTLNTEKRFNTLPPGDTLCQTQVDSHVACRQYIIMGVES